MGIDVNAKMTNGQDAFFAKKLTIIVLQKNF